jgi:uncharacterized protein (TIRG00374 family)
MKYLKILIGHLISFFFIYILVRELNIDKLDGFYQDIHWEYFFLAMFINIISYFIHSLRWSQFFKDSRVNLSNTVKTILIGHMFNTILPSKAGELIRPMFYHRLSQIPYVTVLTTCFIERIFDGLTVLLCLFASILYFGNDTFVINSTLITTAVYCLAIIACIISYFKYDLVKKIFSRLPQNKIITLISDLFEDFIGGLKKINNFKILSNIIFFTLLYWFLNIMALWAILYSLNLPDYIQNPMTAVFIAGIMGVALSLPSAPANIGVYHYAIYFIFTVIVQNTPGGLGNSELFVLAAILIHLGAIIPDLLLGAISYYTFPKKDNLPT